MYYAHSMSTPYAGQSYVTVNEKMSMTVDCVIDSPWPCHPSSSKSNLLLALGRSAITKDVLLQPPLILSLHHCRSH